MYSPHPNIDPQWIEHLVYSDRHFAHFPGMREYDYLSFGLLNKHFKNILGKPRGNIEKGFIQSHILMVDFLTKTLKTNQEFRLEPIYSEMDTSFTWMGAPPFPSMAVIKNKFINHGLPYLDSLFQTQKEFTTHPFSKKFIRDFRNWVGWKKDENFKIRIRLHELALKAYPYSIEFNYLLGSYSLQAGDTTRAITQFKKTEEILSSELDMEIETRMKRRIKERLAGYNQTLRFK
ncbi:MAG: hypothetical protein RLO81_19105, partial [Fulvivirga sp.]|uniref:hypothetical protein n=1 Tax=Fulvivirga sp. TaxID=1931237 RepID=UPI0032EDB246